MSRAMPIVLPAGSVWQTTDLDRLVAEELFGWKWLSYIGIPVSSAKDYPKERRVRRFFPPNIDTDERWQAYLKKREVAPATGDEPLEYAYCSSSPPHRVPHFSGHEGPARDMEREIERRGLHDKYKQILAVQQGALKENGKVDRRRMRYVTYDNRCIAALAAVGSKHVKRVDET